MAIDSEKLKILSILSMDLERGELPRYIDETGGEQILDSNFHGYRVNSEGLYLVVSRLKKEKPESLFLEVYYILLRHEDGKLSLEKINPSILSEETAEKSGKFIDKLTRRLYGAQQEDARLEQASKDSFRDYGKKERRAISSEDSAKEPTPISPSKPASPKANDKEERLRKILKEETDLRELDTHSLVERLVYQGGYTAEFNDTGPQHQAARRLFKKGHLSREKDYRDGTAYYTYFFGRGMSEKMEEVIKPAIKAVGENTSKKDEQDSNEEEISKDDET